MGVYQVQCAYVELERRLRRFCGLCFEQHAAKCTSNTKEGKSRRELA